LNKIPSNAHSRALQRTQTLARLMDNAIRIPGTRYRFGLDPILGLLPGGGDVASMAISGYIIWQAWQIGATTGTLRKMLLNLLIDAAVGTVPLAGDVFDFAFKANRRNVALLEEELLGKETLKNLEEQGRGDPQSQ